MPVIQHDKKLLVSEGNVATNYIRNMKLILNDACQEVEQLIAAEVTLMLDQRSLQFHSDPILNSVIEHSWS